MKTWAWWRSRAAELAVALVMATVVIEVSRIVTDRQREAVPASAWMRVNEVYVPDFQTGGDPTLIYDRTVLEEFDGFWIVEVQRQTASGLWTTVCSGSGVNSYSPSEIIENNTVTWSWYVGTRCVVPEGSYRLRTTYTLARSGWPPKRVFNLSNEFNVTS